jgi:hypothetical protein
LARVIFEPKLFLYKHPNNLIPVILPAYTDYEDGIDRDFRIVGTQNSDARELPKRKNNTGVNLQNFSLYITL